MKLKRVGLVILTAFVVFIATVVICEWRWSVPAGRADVGKIKAATQAYVRQMKAAGRTAPTKVELKELIALGLLKTADVSAFEGMEVTVSLSEDVRPGAVLMSARMPDGGIVTLLGDGSVQQMAR